MQREIEEEILEEEEHEHTEEPAPNPPTQ